MLVRKFRIWFFCFNNGNKKNPKKKKQDGKTALEMSVTCNHLTVAKQLLSWHKIRLREGLDEFIWLLPEVIVELIIKFTVFFPDSMDDTDSKNGLTAEELSYYNRVLHKKERMIRRKKEMMENQKQTE